MGKFVFAVQQYHMSHDGKWTRGTASKTRETDLVAYLAKRFIDGRQYCVENNGDGVFTAELVNEHGTHYVEFVRI